MKKPKQFFYMLLLTTGIFTVSSCSKEPIAVPYNVGEITACLPANPNFGPYYVQTAIVNQSDMVATLQASGVTFSADRIESAKFEEGTVVVTSTGLTFGEISSVELYVREVGQTVDGTQIAYSSDIPAGATSLLLKINGPELKPFVLLDKFELVLKVLNKDKAGGTPPVCVKLNSGRIVIQARK